MCVCEHVCNILCSTVYLHSLVLGSTVSILGQCDFSSSFEVQLTQ